MPSQKFIVSSRSTKGGPTQQVTIPAAIARKLPQHVSIRWEVSVVKGGLFFRYLGPNADKVIDAPEVTLDFVPVGDLKVNEPEPTPTKKKAAAKPKPEAEVPAEVIPPAPTQEIYVDEDEVVVTLDEANAAEDLATDSSAEQAEDVEVEAEADMEEAPF